MGVKSGTLRHQKFRRPFFNQIENGSFARGVLQTARKNRSDRNVLEHFFTKVEDVPKMVSKLFKIAQKRSQNDPNMAQDWIKLHKIAPKTAQDSPKWVHKVTL